jgi:hypothetical protein
MPLWHPLKAKMAPVKKTGMKLDIAALHRPLAVCAPRVIAEFRR